MRECAELVGGRLRLVSTPGGGITVELHRARDSTPCPPEA
jgi:hypothetical protein